MEALSNYSVLYPMGGSYAGKIAEHSAPKEVETKEAATQWAAGRFADPQKALVIDLRDHGIDVSSEAGPFGLTSEVRNRIYKEAFPSF
jgi:hypothetical protein